MKNKFKIVLALFVAFCIFTGGGIAFANENIQKQQKYLIVCGTPVGIKLQSDGVIVTGFIGYLNENDEYFSPAKIAGIKEGDRIVEINNSKIKSIEDMQSIIRNCGENITVVVENQDGRLKYNLKSSRDKDSGEFKIGIWAKDKISGIGTLTYYDDSSKTFGALGHAISDGKCICEISGGLLYEAKITNIKQGVPGCPGELHGYFEESDGSLGKVYSNTSKGIFGKIQNKPAEFSEFCKMPVALGSEVKRGKANIISSAVNGKREEYAIEIVKINEKNNEGTKCFDIRITDKRLLDSTGGIVQGMSGSPIIQDGKLVGAVTHVLVNDPTRGYGIFIENMLEHS